QAEDQWKFIEAVKDIPNDGPANWEFWNKIGMAIWAASGGSHLGGFAWFAWSAQNPCHSEDACLERWIAYTKCPPAEIGAGTIFHLARAAQAERQKPAEDPLWVNSSAWVPAEVP